MCRDTRPGADSVPGLRGRVLDAARRRPMLDTQSATKSHMVTIGDRELRRDASRWLARVRAGEPVVVTDRGRPVAKMVYGERLRRAAPRGNVRLRTVSLGA